MVEKKSVAVDVKSAMQEYTNDFAPSWSFGSNWDASLLPQAETFINKYLFPKITETKVLLSENGNRFQSLAVETDFIGQFSEEYVIMDAVPVNMNLTKNEELMLKRNYPKMATKLFGAGTVKKQKFTLNNNDVRLNFSTMGQLVNYALAVYKKRLNDINVLEESEMKGMIVDYALNQTNTVRPATTIDQLVKQISVAILNMQNNSSLYNETNKASGGAIGRRTIQSQLSNMMILTTDTVKEEILNSIIANTFNVAGLDLTERIISFDTLGGVYKTTSDITINDTTTISKMRAMGDYQVAIGDLVPAGSVFTYDITSFTEFYTTGATKTPMFIEVKPKTDYFAHIFDSNCIKYKQFTKGMLKEPFKNSEFDEITHWIHYYSSKNISPFYNNIRVGA